MSVPDLHATILHQLGRDHRRLGYRHYGREKTLTNALIRKAGVVAKLLQKPPEIRKQETVPALSIRLTRSRIIEPKKPC